jgi:hypothetical protein
MRPILAQIAGCEIEGKMGAYLELDGQKNRNRTRAASFGAAKLMLAWSEFWKT